MDINQELVNSIFQYREGELFWKIVTGQRAKIGFRAGFKAKATGRNFVRIRRKTIFSARVIFLMHHGYLPEIVDHIDRECTNDKIENLRAATKSQNNRNTNRRKNSSSKYLGVGWSKVSSKWRAQITVDKKTQFICLSESEVHCALAYNKHAVKNHGEFANLNIITP